MGDFQKVGVQTGTRALSASLAVGLGELVLTRAAERANLPSRCRNVCPCSRPSCSHKTTTNKPSPPPFAPRGCRRRRFLTLTSELLCLVPGRLCLYGYGLYDLMLPVCLLPAAACRVQENTSKLYLNDSVTATPDFRTLVVGDTTQVGSLPLASPSACTCFTVYTRQKTQAEAP